MLKIYITQIDHMLCHLHFSFKFLHIELYPYHLVLMLDLTFFSDVFTNFLSHKRHEIAYYFSCKPTERKIHIRIKGEFSTNCTSMKFLINIPLENLSLHKPLFPALLDWYNHCFNVTDASILCPPRWAGTDNKLKTFALVYIVPLRPIYLLGIQDSLKFEGTIQKYIMFVCFLNVR